MWRADFLWDGRCFAPQVVGAGTKPGFVSALPGPPEEMSSSWRAPHGVSLRREASSGVGVALLRCEYLFSHVADTEMEPRFLLVFFASGFPEEEALLGRFAQGLFKKMLCLRTQH